MSTHGLCGFLYNGQFKMQYVHFDGYPEGLGREVVEFIRSHTIEDMIQIFNNIILVKPDTIPTQEQIIECQPYADLTTASRSDKDWYCLLRKAQGNLSVYEPGKLRYMVNLGDDWMNTECYSYSYVIDLDEKVLEISGTYYHPVNFPLDNIPDDWEERFLAEQEEDE